ncbi:LOW QUALITY PROTEIN: hypothetical protein Cgig2_026196 [Carnegiea gigantea]|uniref:Uncharacterized protein n=1 Tax=Carnegiea gigantea TaxID=171969 RepID=A0A9Q1GNE0_9CARY|nr:LOW QUALITY PROTEIN: hypothetical protein Cgig2_026196 [Carnegiea gigantea]
MNHIDLKNKSITSKSTRSARSSWKDNTQFDAKQEFLTIDDLGKEEVINRSILPQDIMNYNKGFIYLADKAFDKCVLKHVAKHFKQYNHGLKKDYFKPEEKTKEDMYDIVPKGQSRDGWMRLVDYWCLTQHETLAEIGKDARALQTHCHTTGSTSYAEKRAGFVETHEREPTHLEFFEETHSREGGGFVANTAIEGFLVYVLILCLMNLCMKKKIPSDRLVFASMWTKVMSLVVLRKRGYVFPDNNMELKRVKEELPSQKAMFLLMLKAVCNGKITNEFLDTTEVFIRMAGDQVQEESSGNDLSNGSRHTGPSTSTSRVN